jgi:hypothetical protein
LKVALNGAVFGKVEKQKAKLLTFTNLDQPLARLTELCIIVVESSPECAVFWDRFISYNSPA